ncbi:unnamed protein product [Bursaphelenchus xylophilus]|uniref:N-acetylphosphatidylethanolamine-hydrolyzing phospholipase D n=1 Tax=Bursaphelenchus xylophilus TaxID=6326 RepID=A0A1I7RTI1_BURXY|nr:unnamed protein product [Bursaphelenchus xylophilus]CAG9122443.1 unnamed protein product [Bursaphelenchus xylophilus]
MGHATVYVHLEGFSFITDPVWAQRVSPFSFAGPVRYRPSPCRIDEIPKLDFGVISHNHYDHMDYQAIKELSKQFPEMKWFVPKGLKRSMVKLTKNEVHEMAWGEQYTLNKDGKEIQVWCVPAQHWSTRCIFDKNKSLWSGWAVTGQEKRFYFAGDTGFCEEEFGRIGKILGPFDLAAIPIGAYAPRYFMKGQHIDPEEAVKVHQLVKAKHSIGIHWGTYPMGSTEPYLEPKTKLKEEVEKAGLSADAMITVEHGSTWTENMVQEM